MKLKLTKEAAQALTNLRGNSNFSDVLEWLKDGRSASRDQCQDAEGVTLYRAQGAAKVLTSFFECVENAPEVTEKFKQ